MEGISAARLTPEIDALPIPISLWEAVGDDFVLADFNEAAAQLTGGRMVELLGRTVRDLYGDEYGVLESMRDVSSTGTRIRREVDFRMRSTGEQRTFNVSYIRLNPGQVLVVTEDLTVRRIMENALRESERRYRTLVEGAPDGIVVHRGGRIVFVNDAFVQMLRAPSHNAIVGKAVLDLVHPADREQVRSRIGAIMDGGAAPILEERLIRTDGTVMYAEIAGIPTTFDNEPAVQAIVRDVSERRRAETMVYALSEQSLTGISVIQDGRFVYANPRCAELFGYTPDEIIGMEVEPMIAHKSLELVRHMQRRRLDEGSGSVQYTFTAHRKDGTEIEIDVFGSVIELEGKPALVGTLLDTTERERMGEQLRQAQKMDAIGQLAGGVAHDFNNILTAISAYSELLLEQMEHDSPMRRDVIEIRNAGQRATELTRQLLAFSRRQALQPQLLDVNQVLESMSHMLRRLIDERIALTLDLAKERTQVLADRGQLEQVVLNLSLNGRDAMPDGGRLTLSAGHMQFDAAQATAHAGLQPGTYTFVRVADTGEGMPPTVAARVFEPFFTTKPAGQGTGLGLAVVYGIVKQSGGYIMLDTAPGQGASFTVLLPAIQG